MLYHSDITDEQHKIEYVEALIDAFKQIDVNGDATLEWNEFSNYIVETGKSYYNPRYRTSEKNIHRCNS
jgi:hypothetical protein